MSNYDVDMNKQGNAIDMARAEFDLTWMSMPQYKDQRTFNVLPIEDSDDDGEVTYNFNKDGFRCDDFTSTHVPGKHILFGGCSQTEGVGSPLDTIWPKMIHDQLTSLGMTDGYFNLARSGYGWQKIIASFLTYSKQYGYPDYFFVLLPNIGRFFEWDSDTNSWFYVQRYPGKGNALVTEKREVKPSVLNQYPLTIDEHRRSLVDFYLGWRTLIELCNSNGTKLVWSTWDYDELNNYKMFESENTMISLTSKDFQNYFIAQRPDGKEKKHDIKRRDGHHGILHHMYWYESFMKEIDDRGWLK